MKALAGEIMITQKSVKHRIRFVKVDSRGMININVRSLNTRSNVWLMQTKYLHNRIKTPNSYQIAYDTNAATNTDTLTYVSAFTSILKCTS